MDDVMSENERKVFKALHSLSHRERERERETDMDDTEDDSREHDDDMEEEEEEEEEEDVPMLDSDCEVLYESPNPGSVEEPVSDDLSQQGALLEEGLLEGELGDFHSPFLTFQELLLTLLDSGTRTSKGLGHALAPHCLRPFMGLTPELIQGARGRGTGGERWYSATHARNDE